MSDKPKKIIIISSKESMGNGPYEGKEINYQDMDRIGKIQQPWMSLLIPELVQLNYEVEVVNWRNTELNWRKENDELVVMGPVWDYFSNIPEFQDFLSKLETSGVIVANPVDLMKFNIDKNYLSDFQGTKFLNDTKFIQSNSQKTLKDVIESMKKEESLKDEDSIVLKGIIDGNATATRKIKVSEISADFSNHFKKVKKENQGVIIQKFIPEISQGEFSFVFFGDTFSHSYLKVGTINDYRVQASFGGKSFHFHTGDKDLKNSKKLTDSINDINNHNNKSLFDVRISKDIFLQALQAAQKIHTCTNQKLTESNIKHPCYQRIDIVRNGKDADNNILFSIMEIEMIEPYMEIKQAQEKNPEANTVSLYINHLEKLFQANKRERSPNYLILNPKVLSLKDSGVMI